MVRLADLSASLSIALILALVALGAAMQVELIEPGVQVFLQSSAQDTGTGWTLYPPLSTGAPDGLAYTRVHRWHMALGMALVFALGLLAACLLHSRRLAWTTAGLAVIWIAGIMIVRNTLLADRNFGTSFFDPNGGGTDPIILYILEWAFRPSIWHIFSTIPFTTSYPLGARDLVLEFATFAAVSAPVLMLVLLTVNMVQLLARPLGWTGLIAACIALAATLLPPPGRALFDTQVHTSIAHLGLGGLAVFGTGALLLGWLDLRGRSLPRGVVLAGLLITGAVLAVSALLSFGLARQGLPRAYLDYPDIFAPGQFRLAVVNFALAGMIVLFLAAVIWRRLSPITADETADPFA